MKSKVVVPASLKGKVVAVGAAVTTEDLDAYDRLKGITDRSEKLQKILSAWERQHSEERDLRRAYGRYLLWALAVQGGLVNLAFFALGFGWIVVDPWIAKTFILAVFGEIAGMVFFVIKYLFPKASDDVLATIKKL